MSWRIAFFFLSRIHFTVYVTYENYKKKQLFFVTKTRRTPITVMTSDHISNHIVFPNKL